MEGESLTRCKRGAPGPQGGEEEPPRKVHLHREEEMLPTAAWSMGTGCGRWSRANTRQARHFGEAGVETVWPELGRSQALIWSCKGVGSCAG